MIAVRRSTLLRCVGATLAITASQIIHAQFLAPASNLVLEGVPPIPNELVTKIQPYTDFKRSTMAAWHPTKPGILIRTRASNTNQLHLVATPGSAPEQLTDFADAVFDGSFQPKKGEYVLFEKSSGGDEAFRIYRLDLATQTVTPITSLSSERERASTPAWNRKGDRIVYSTVTLDRNNASRMAITKAYIADPLKPAETRHIATLDGGGMFDFCFSPDDKQLAFQEYISAAESHLWTIDIASGEKRRISPAPKRDAPAYYGSPHFTRDGKGLYALSDRDNEFMRLIHIELATGKETVLTESLKFDVDSFASSDAAKRIAFVTNEEGSGVLRFLDLTTWKELPRPALLPGIISGLRWNNGADDDESPADENAGKELAFNLASARSPGDVYSFNTRTTKLARWTNNTSPALNPLDFVEPTIARWNSFDGRQISGFVYQPDARKFPGKRPVIIDIHGGPEDQARPGFIGRSNYLVNEGGIAIIFPNVRGSSGFGKTFLTLDNGSKREDAVNDIGALFDWIKTQPNMDPARVLVSGGSYGGYMSLAVSACYADRIAGAIDEVGIANFATYLINTESYRRDLRRAEYGDERDPAIRAFFEKISPLNNAEKITKPLFVVLGKNDPRVPHTESLQMVAQLKKQKTPVWLLMANDEAYDETRGFAKKGIADFLFYAQVRFIEEMLLK